MDEAGFPGFEAVGWYSLFAPKGTPADNPHRRESGGQRHSQDGRGQEIYRQSRIAGHGRNGGRPAGLGRERE